MSEPTTTETTTPEAPAKKRILFSEVPESAPEGDGGPSALTSPIALPGLGSGVTPDVDLTQRALIESMGPWTSPSPPPSDEDMPFDAWVANLVDWDTGEYVAEVYREQPEKHFFDELRRSVPVKGCLASYRKPPTLGIIETEHGGGTRMKCVVLGPDKTGNRSGQMVPVTRPRLFSVVGEPKIPALMRGKTESGETNVSAQLAQASLDALQKQAMEKGAEAARERARADEMTRTKDAAGQASAAQAFSVVEKASERAADAYKERAEAAERRAAELDQQVRELGRKIDAKPAGPSQDMMMGGAFEGFAKALGAVTQPFLSLQQQPRSNGDNGESVRDALREAGDRHSRELSELMAKYQKEASEERGAHLQQLADLRVSHQQQLDRQHAQNEKNITEERAAHRQAIDDLRAQHTHGTSDLNERHKGVVEELRRTYEREIADLKDAMRKQEADFRESRAELRQEFTDRREEDVRRAVSEAKSAHEVVLASKDAHVTMLQSDREKLRDDLKDTRDRLTKTELELGDVRHKLLKAEAELTVRPKPGTTGDIETLDKLVVMRDKLDNVFGGGKGKGRRVADEEEDSPPDDRPWWERLLDNETVQTVATRIAGEITGGAEAERKKEVAIAETHSKTETARALRDAHVARERTVARSGGRLPPAAGQPGAAMTSAPVENLYAPRPGEDALPDPPVSREVKGDASMLKDVLLASEQCIRQGAHPGVLIDEIQRQNPAFGPETLKAQITSQASVTEFLAHLEADGAQAAFPVLWHPSGRRWLKDLWAEVERRATKKRMN